MSKKIILASGSSARQAILKNAGLNFDIVPADIDERAIADQLSAMPTSNIALRLAEEKAKSISSQHPNAIVIGSDQVLLKDNVIYNKAADKAAAFDRLQEFQGITHSLISSVVVSIDGETVWSHTDQADLTMKQMTDDAINDYIENAGDAVTQCVGCYALEGLGIRLFNDIKGDYFTILGMPLLPLLNYLDGEGC